MPPASPVLLSMTSFQYKHGGFWLEDGVWVHSHDHFSDHACCVVLCDHTKTSMASITETQPTLSTIRCGKMGVGSLVLGTVFLRIRKSTNT
jgi:hypothetical protein